MTSASSDDRHSQFLISIGELCLSASSAALTVRVVLRDGTEISGIPTVMLADPTVGELDETGFANPLHLNGSLLRLADVETCSISAPTPPG